jgi:hypothetical protein
MEEVLLGHQLLSMLGFDVRGHFKRNAGKYDNGCQKPDIRRGC